MATSPADAFRATSKHLASLYADSGQGMYLYMDDGNKSCNDRFAKLLGYASPAQWAAVTESFPMAFVDAASRHDLVGAYQDAMADGVASQSAVTWRRKDGKTVASTVILVPIEHDGHRMALHFVKAA